MGGRTERNAVVAAASKRTTNALLSRFEEGLRAMLCDSNPIDGGSWKGSMIAASPAGRRT